MLSAKGQVHYIELKLETVLKLSKCQVCQVPSAKCQVHELSECQVCQVPSAKCQVHYIELKLETVL